MAAKQICSGGRDDNNPAREHQQQNIHHDDADDHDQKRIKVSHTLAPTPFGQSLAQAKLMKSISFRGLCTFFEPFLRRVVSEEVEHGIERCLLQNSSPSTAAPSPPTTLSPTAPLRILQIAPLHEPLGQSSLPVAATSTLHLVFKDKPCLSIFTGSKLVDIKKKPLQVHLIKRNSESGETTIIPPPYPLKLEIVVVDGDFDCDNGHNTWSLVEFKKNVVKEREGKRPLLAGELNYTMKVNGGEGIVEIGDIEFTDNSSWIRGRKFRLGARVVHHDCSSLSSADGGAGVRVYEAVTEAFVVKDHRGESYKKHYPPSLTDEVWRLEKIGKDGKFHTKLAEENINTVQDLLKLASVDIKRLRNVLGQGMSDKMWESTFKHAKTCQTDNNKLYVARGPEFCIVLNSICEIVKVITINGLTYYNIQNLSTATKRKVESLVKEAYTKWDTLEVVDEPAFEVMPMTIDHQMMAQQMILPPPASISQHDQQTALALPAGPTSLQYSHSYSQPQILGPIIHTNEGPQQQQHLNQDHLQQFHNQLMMTTNSNTNNNANNINAMAGMHEGFGGRIYNNSGWVGFSQYSYPDT